MLRGLKAALEKAAVDENVELATEILHHLRAFTITQELLLETGA